MAEKDKKKADFKAFLRAAGPVISIVGLIVVVAGIVLLAVEAALNTVLTVSVVGTAVAFAGTVAVIVGVRKDKTEKAPQPVNCKYCGELNPAGSKFCRKCGKPIVKKCVNCGAELDMDAKFCNTCGVRVRDDQ